MPVNLYTIGRKFQKDLAASENWALRSMLAKIARIRAELEAELKALDRLGKLTPSKIRQLNRAKAGVNRLFRDLYDLPPDLDRLGAGLALEHVREAAAEQLGKYAGAITLGEGDIGAGENLRTAAGLQQSGAIKRLFASAQGQTTALVESLFNYHLARQSGPMALARDLRAVHNVSKTRAQTIARTELLRTYRETTRRVYQENSDLIQQYIWVSSRGRRTCAVCWAMHGSLHETSEPFGTHPNCRCVMVPYMGGPLPRPGAAEFDGLSDVTKSRILGPKKFAAYKEQGIGLQYVVGYKYHPDYGPVRYLQNFREFEGRTSAPGAWGLLFNPDPRRPRPKPPKPPAPIPIAKKKIAAAKAAAPGPARKVPLFTTSAEAEAWAAKKFNIEVDFTIDRKKRPGYMPVQFAQETVEEFAELAEEFPAVAARLQYLGTYRRPTQFKSKFAGELAHASVDGYRIGLNPSWYGNPKVFLEAAGRAGKNNFTYQKQNSVRATLRHEFGHQIDAWIGRLGGWSVADGLFMDDSGLFYKIMAPFRDALRANVRWSRRGANLTTVGLSKGRYYTVSEAALSRLTKYGYANEAEMFAESFSGLKYGTGARSDFSRRFEAMLTELKKSDIVNFDSTGRFQKVQQTSKLFKDSRQVPFTINLTSAERDKVRADLAKILKRFNQWEGFQP